MKRVTAWKSARAIASALILGLAVSRTAYESRRGRRRLCKPAGQARRRLVACLVLLLARLTAPLSEPRLGQCLCCKWPRLTMLLLLLLACRPAFAYDEDTNWAGWGFNDNWSTPANWSWGDVPDYFGENAVFKKDATVEIDKSYSIYGLQVGWDIRDSGVDVILIGQSDGSKYLTMQRLAVPDGSAWNGNGTLLLKRKAVLACQEASIGDNAPGVCTVDDSGLVATKLILSPIWRSGSSSYTANMAHGELYCKNGAKLETTEAIIGESDASTSAAHDKTPSRVEVTGSGTRWLVDRLKIAPTADARGEVWIKDGALVIVSDEFSLPSHSVLHVSGGTLRVDSEFTKPGGNLDFTAGTLELRFAVRVETDGPLGTTISLGAGKTLNATAVRLMSSDYRIDLIGGVLNAGVLDLLSPANFSDTAASTTWVNSVTGVGTLHLLGTLNVGGAGPSGSAGNLTVSNAGGVRTLQVDKALNIKSGKLSVSTQGELAAADVLKLMSSSATLEIRSGGKVTAKSVDSSAGTLSLLGGELVINGGTLKLPAPFILDDSAPVSLKFTNGGTASAPSYASIGKTGYRTATLTQTDGTVNIAATLRLGEECLFVNGNPYPSHGAYTLAGTGKLNANGNYQVVGYQGEGTFNLNGGINNVHKYLYLGEGVTGEGTYNVNGGTLNVGDSLYVGGNSGGAGGTGTLTINSGTVTVANTLKLWSGGTLNLNGGVLTVGALDAQLGTVNYNGGQLKFTGEIRIGTGGNYGTSATIAGANTLAAPAGVSVIADGSLTARDGGTVDASGSHCKVGNGGTGTLTVPAGGTVCSGSGYVGLGAGGNGTATVSGTGRWTNAGGLQIGATAQGALTIQAGGTVINTTGRIAYETGSQGAATVDGGAWNNSSFLTVGRKGVGTLTIRNGGAVTNTDTYIGDYAGSDGTLTVTGASTTYSPGNGLYLGGDNTRAGGTGRLIVDQSAHVTVPGTLGIWPNGTLTVKHDYATVTAHTLCAEGAALDIQRGTFTVEDGAVSGTDLTVQGGAGGYTYLRDIEGELTGRLTVGDATPGAMYLVDSSLTLGSTFTVGKQSGSQSSLYTQTGSSSSLNGTTAVFGSTGRALVDLNGGSFYLGNNLYLGNENSSANGECNLRQYSGATTALSVSSLIVGNQGTGRLNQQQGTTTVRSSLYVGYGASGLGYVTTSPGAGALTVNGSTYVGYGGLGRLTLASTPVTCKGMVRIGNNQGSDGTLTLQGAVRFNNEASYQVVGYQGKGTVAQSGTSTNQVSMYLFIAEGSTSTGAYNLTSGTLNVGQDLCVGGNTGAAGGTGTLTIGGGEVHITGTLRLWNKGTVTITGGKVYVDVVDNTHGGTFNLNGGELHVREFRGNLTNNGGKVCPGSSPGTTTILGDYLQGPGGTLQIELSSISDLLAVTGQMSLGGNLEVLPFDGFSLLTGFSVDCLDWQTLAGQFDGLNLPALPEGVSWDLSALYTDGQLGIANLVGPFAVSGTVRNAELAGLAGVTVTAKVGFIPAGTATTGADGSYTLTLPPGVYTVTAAKFGSTFSPSSQSVTVAGPVVGVDFAVSGAPATYSVRGTIHDADGNTLVGVVVTADGKTALTGSDGTYCLSGLVAGTYTFVPVRAGNVFDPVSVEREVLANVTALDFTAAVGNYTLSGTVRDAGGVPLAGATIIGGGQAATTGEDGTYTLAGLFPGPCVVLPGLSGYTFAPAVLAVTIAGDQAGVDFTATVNPYAVSGTVLDSLGAPLAGVTVIAGDRTAMTAADGTYAIERLAAGIYPVTPFGEELAFTPASQAVTVGPSQNGVDFVGAAATYTISGLITDGATPLAGVTVTVDGATATTDATGIYVLTGLVAGSYTVTPSKAGHIFDPESTPVVVGPDRVAVDFAATPAPYAVSGTVRDGTGTAMADIMVTLGTRTTTTDADGTYVFENLVDSAYTVTPSAPERTFTPTSLEVMVGPSRSDVDFTGVPTTYTVSGTVTDGSNPLSGVTVSAGTESAVTGVDGTYALTLEAGQFDVIPSLAAFAFTPDARAVILGPAVAGMDFVGGPDVYTISGLATDGEANPLAGVQVTAGETTVTTDEGGAYAFTDLAAGTYDVTVQMAEYTFDTASQPVTVGPDQVCISFTGTVNTYMIGGTLRDAGGQPLADVDVTLGETTVTTGADGTYAFSGLLAGTYEVTPALDEMTFAPASHTATVGPDAAGMDFVGTVSTYSISGTVRDGADAPLAGIEVSGGGQTATTGADGTYTLVGFTADTVLVEPSAAHRVFTPAHQTVPVGPDHTDVDFVAGVDSDGDGTPDAIENGAPNAGDGNGDATLDALQPHVVSLPNGEDGDYVTMIADIGQAFWNVQTDIGPQPGDAPMALDLPAGTVAFELQGVTPGGAATVTIMFHDEPASPAYYVVGPTPDAPDPHWYEFAYDGTTGVEMQGNTVVLHFVDGQRGDWDLTADGVIRDPGGPGSVLEPIVTGVAPAIAQVGRTVTVSGTNLTGATEVRFAGTPAVFAVLGDTAIAVVVPVGAAVGPITVVTPGGTATSPDDFTPLAVMVPPGNALDFDGTDDHVALPHEVAASVGGTDAITIEYWFKGDQLQSPVRLQDGAGWIVAGVSDPPQHIVSTDGGAVGISCGPEATIEDGRWHHLAMTWQRDTVNGFVSYLDGVVVTQRTSIAASLPTLTSATPYLGCLNGTSEFLSGSLDEVRIWNVALDADQIRDGMHRELNGDEAGLVAYYTFNHTDGALLWDASGNGNDGALRNMSDANWIASTGPVANLSATNDHIRGVWTARTHSLASSILSVSNAVVSDTSFRVFGHDGGALTNDTPDKPAGYAWRLDRAWQAEGAGSVSGALSFDCSGITGLIQNPSLLRLMTDTDGAFANAGGVAGTYAGNVFTITGQTLPANGWYTLGERSTANWVIAASAGSSGTIAPVGNVVVAPGGTSNFVITPADYYHVADVTTNGASVGAVTEFTWSNVTADGTIHADFAADLAAQGTPHRWLADHGLTGDFDAAEAANPDNDPFTTAEEYVADTNPTNAASYFCIATVSNLPPWTVYFEASTNRAYTLIGVSNLSSGVWTPVPGAGPRLGAGGPDSMQDTNEPPAGPFYRLKVELP